MGFPFHPTLHLHVMAMQIWNNSPRMNLPEALYINIQSNSYFKDLMRLKTYHEVLSEIRREVKNLEPRIKGRQMPSTAWCLLFKLYTLKLTEKQLGDMLDNETNPCIRGLAMLYLRLTCIPKDMWSWFEPYLIDDHEIPVSHSGATLPLGLMVKQLIEEQKFCDVLLPRIPVPIQRSMQEQIKQQSDKLPAAPAPPAGGSRRSHGNKRDQRDNRYSSPRDRRDRDRRRSPSPYRRDRSPDHYRGRDRDSRRSHRDYSPRGRDYDRDHRRRDYDRGYDRSSRDYSPRDREYDRDRRGSDRRSYRDRDDSPYTRPSRQSPSRSSRDREEPPKKPADSAQLAKLKAMYGTTSQADKPKRSGGMYGDSLDTDVVRIGFQ